MKPRSDKPRGELSGSGRSCLLVVEDELLIRLMVSDELRDAGYDVIEACNADEAIAVLKSGVPVELIFSDVRMPGSVDGLGLLDFVRGTFPDLPIILTSGNLERPLGTGDSVTRFVAKPYSLEGVVNMVRAELSGAT